VSRKDHQRWHITCVSGGIPRYGQVEKMDCRANGEVIFKVIRTLHLGFLKYPDPWSSPGLFQQKEMGYAIKSFNPRTTDTRYPMLPTTITNIHQAFKEIKYMAIDTWQEECRPAARRSFSVERLILLSFLLGFSPRKVGPACCRFWANRSAPPPSVKLPSN
jgi:hypothetical protein